MTRAGAGSAPVAFGFADIHGSLRGKVYDAAAFEAIRARGHAPVSDLMLAVDPLDEPITTFDHIGLNAGAGDLRLVPAERVFPALPGRREAICLGSLEWNDGTPCEYSARGVLERAVELLASQGLSAMAAVEYELRVWHRDGDRPITAGQSYSLTETGVVFEFVEQVRAACAVLDIELSAAHTEAGAGLIEVNLAAAPALEAADQAFLLRHVAREVAGEHGLRVSFMAKPVAGEEGSSGHVHISAWRNGRNVTAGIDPDRPSATMRHMAAGILRHLPAISVLLNPTINSYKRLVPGFFAPVNVSWGIENRSAAVRAILGDDPARHRLEVRRPGADANPYLALAAIVAAAASGIADEAEPPPPLEGDASRLPPDIAPPLPTSLESAVERLSADAATIALIGERFVEYYLTTRRWELRAWQLEVTDWERRRYALLA